MKRFLIIVLALFGAIVGLLLVNDIINFRLVFASASMPRYKMHRLFNEPLKSEIPILGSSRAEAGFAPSVISPRSFNYGISGSGQWETLLHLKAVCARGDVGAVIVNFDPWGLGGKGRFQGDYSLAYGSPILKGYENETHVQLLDRLPGTRFYGALRSNIADYLNSVFAATKRIDNGAILQRLSRTPEEWKYIIGKCKPLKFSINQETWAEYKKVLTANKNVKIVFVVSPVAPSWWERFADKEELAAFLKEVAQFPNVVVMDMCSTNITRYDLSWFMDLTHLNEKGAMRFSEELKAELQLRGLL